MKNQFDIVVVYNFFTPSNILGWRVGLLESTCAVG